MESGLPHKDAGATQNLEEHRKRRDQRREASEEEVEHEKRKLETLADALGDAEYFIGGGLVMELMEGKIRYKHEDIDINIFKDEEGKVLENLSRKGFELKRLPPFKGHDLEAMNFEVDEESGRILREPTEGEWLYIGVFLLERDTESGTAIRYGKDGNIDSEFPLSYYDREKQTVEFEGRRYTVCDPRLIVSEKLLSIRPKDLRDVETLLPMIKKLHGKEGIEELKGVCGRNLETKGMNSLRFLFEKFLATAEKVNGENAYGFFLCETQERMKTADDEYVEAAGSALENIRKFRASSTEEDRVKEELWECVDGEFKNVFKCQRRKVNMMLDGKLS